MIAVVCAGIGDVVEHLFSGESVAIGNAEQAYGPESAFGVYV